ncbi:uncharacterized protein CIMG_12255 [Coccidioides immitis RS]|uniref:Uncharacterized protein n=1 Tax=Coccidioides immitis (strain RS) TaxID=246410 RepID=A0A0D8JW03_COCIM|nr:uncharacterized protein CIMG_12255 [Coccidioides immitis RS]KJF61299.1 hypothetical protein CIMG_12255 [Coccidioides immitis RS]
MAYFPFDSPVVTELGDPKTRHPPAANSQSGQKLPFRNYESFRGKTRSPAIQQPLLTARTVTVTFPTALTKHVRPHTDDTAFATQRLIRLTSADLVLFSTPAPCDTEEPTKHDIASCSPPMKTRMYITPEGGLHARIDSLFCFIIGTVGQYSSVMLIPGKDKSPIRTSEK